ncbi:MAG: cytochrome c3 family protein [candidate division Zixibacteria bacterium]|nr:cytochrome c3 family protein [candidate division Zixibacteria bacterium]
MNNTKLFHRRVLVVAGLAVLVGFSYGVAKDHEQIPQLDCSECHSCANPSASELCLKPCPSLTMTDVTAKHALKEAPDTFLIGQISDVYQPVRFNHKLHAEMAEMGGNCAICHHYSPSGRIPPCIECHGGEKNLANLRQPSLKGAYHRQCLSCHREWSHQTKCIICHLPTAGREAAAGGYDSTDFIGISHPVITTPSKKVYHTNFEDGPVVTFFHDEHVEMFEIKCVGCHKQENCSDCHDLAHKVGIHRVMVEDHAACYACHQDDECSKCHDTKEKAAFSHASTGWPLNRFHQDLNCRACHPTGKKIAKLNRQCTACHGIWSRNNFRHAVTGLVLSEVHVEAECSDCHAGLKYDQAPTCTNCHGEGEVDPKETPPGEFVNK